MRPTPPRTALFAAAAVAVALPGGSVAASSEPPTPITVPSGEAAAAFDPDGRVDAARDGLAAFLAGFPELDGSDPGDDIELDACPLLSDETLIAAIEPLGEVAPFDELSYAIDFEDLDEGEGVDGSSVAYPVVCEIEVDHPREADAPIVATGLAAIDYPQPMMDTFVEQLPVLGAEQLAEPSAATFGGATLGLCAPDEEAVDCTVLWAHDTFILAILVRTGSETEAPDLADVSDVFLSLLPGLLDDIAALPAAAAERIETSEPTVPSVAD